MAYVNVCIELWTERHSQERASAGLKPLYTSTRRVGPIGLPQQRSTSVIFKKHRPHIFIYPTTVSPQQYIVPGTPNTGLRNIKMAPKRRTQSARSTPSTNQQSKLSFQSKVTKPGINQQTKANKKDPESEEKIAKADVKVEDEPDILEPTSAEKAIQQQTEQEAATVTTAKDPLADGQTVKAEDVLGGRAEQTEGGAVGGKGSGWVADEEAQAREITDTQIKQYWRKKEQERLAPRVHQEDLTVYEKVLREWDMSGQYGVSFTSHTDSLYIRSNC
jgi:DNA polymerase delta subunit 4